MLVTNEMTRKKCVNIKLKFRSSSRIVPSQNVFLPLFHSGLGEGVTFPAVMVILSKWTPPSERSRMTSFNFAGIMFGTVVSLAVTGALCEESQLITTRFQIICFLTWNFSFHFWLCWRNFHFICRLWDGRASSTSSAASASYGSSSGKWHIQFPWRRIIL